MCVVSDCECAFDVVINIIYKSRLHRVGLSRFSLLLATRKSWTLLVEWSGFTRMENACSRVYLPLHINRKPRSTQNCNQNRHLRDIWRGWKAGSIKGMRNIKHLFSKAENQCGRIGKTWGSWMECIKKCGFPQQLVACFLLPFEYPRGRCFGGAVWYVALCVY